MEKLRRVRRSHIALKMKIKIGGLVLALEHED
ncbi:uncharacterized protein G2W53_011917 [Senna tora]|uniref:Uncharacterized protein n=1 Tax=Senna tora TaxID=362788 RepID=A0A834TX61_9FABA|nr:uncharacterized protein G2W53_011917 [Senna tora]